jgi:hypothetical protein
MKYSWDLPTKEGWYWFRDKEYKRSPDFRPVIIVKVEFSMYDGRPLFCDGRLPRDAKEWPGEWAGPIKSPKEGEKRNEE